MMDKFIAAAIPQPKKAIFNIKDAVLVKAISPSVQFIAVTSAHDVHRDTIVYHLKTESSSDDVVVIATEAQLALASRRGAINAQPKGASASEDQKVNNRKFETVTKSEDGKSGDIVEFEPPHVGRQVITEVSSIGHAFGGDPYIKYNSDGDSIDCYFDEVTLLRKGESRGSLNQEDMRSQSYQCIGQVAKQQKVRCTIMRGRRF
jgi:hypothetical protein